MEVLMGRSGTRVSRALVVLLVVTVGVGLIFTLHKSDKSKAAAVAGGTRGATREKPAGATAVLAPAKPQAAAPAVAAAPVKPVEPKVEPKVEQPAALVTVTPTVPSGSSAVVAPMPAPEAT